MKVSNWLLNLKRDLVSHMVIGSSSSPKDSSPGMRYMQVETLEDRLLLASVAFDAGLGNLDFTADAGIADVVTVSAVSSTNLQIQVGNGDEITLQGDAAGNADFQLSTTVNPNDTLQIDVGSSVVNQFTANLLDQSDTFTVANSLAGLPTPFSLTVNGGADNDELDVSLSAISSLLTGGAGNDTLTGGSGDDILAGGGGTDIVDGGDGIDTNSFQGIGLGVTAVVNADGTGTAVYGPVSEAFTGIENLTGSENDDILTATGPAANVLRGEGGDDILAGGGGTDVIDGGEGIDTNSFQGIGLGVTAVVNADGTGTAVYGPVSEAFTGIENLTGSENDDILTATGPAANVLRGEGGNDILAGGGGTDIIDGGEGIDTNSFQGIGLGVTAVVNADGTGTAVYGPVSEAFTGIENLTGSENDDILTATGPAANVLRGEGGNDILAGGGGTDIVDGGEGIDTNSFQGIGLGVTAIVDAGGSGIAVYGSVRERFSNIENLTGSDNNDNLIARGIVVNVLRGGAGNDRLDGGGGADLIFGDAGFDRIIGGNGDDELRGGSGNDAIFGGAGRDTILGGAGNDVVRAGAGEDTVFGNSGQDRLFGGSGNDQLLGGVGSDTIFGNAGNDLILGGAGNDVLLGGVGNDLIRGGSGRDRIRGGFGDDVLAGDAGNDVILGDSGQDRLIGGADNDTLLGGADDDTIFGNAGRDRLVGGAGNDVLRGGPGVDLLLGGPGDNVSNP